MSGIMVFISLGSGSAGVQDQRRNDIFSFLVFLESLIQADIAGFILFSGIDSTSVCKNIASAAIKNKQTFYSRLVGNIYQIRDGNRTYLKHICCGTSCGTDKIMRVPELSAMSGKIEHKQVVRFKITDKSFHSAQNGFAMGFRIQKGIYCIKLSFGKCKRQISRISYCTIQCRNTVIVFINSDK